MQNKGAKGVSAPKNFTTKMPITNQGSMSAKTGTTHSSKMASTQNQPSTGATSKSPTHLPTTNQGQAQVPLGTTKHGVGQVPGYLRGHKSN